MTATNGITPTQRHRGSNCQNSRSITKALPLQGGTTGNPTVVANIAGRTGAGRQEGGRPAHYLSNTGPPSHQMRFTSGALGATKPIAVAHASADGRCRSQSLLPMDSVRRRSTINACTFWSGKARPKQTRDDTAEDLMRLPPNNHDQGPPDTTAEGGNQRRIEQDQGTVAGKEDNQARVL